MVTPSWHGDGKTASVRVWEAKTGKLIKDLVPAGAEAGCVFSPDGRWLATTAIAVGCTLWKVGTWEKVHEYAFTYGLGFSPDGQLLAIGDEAGAIRLVETETNREVARLPGPDPVKYESIFFSDDGAKLWARDAAGSRVYVWDLRKMRSQLKALHLDWDWPQFSPDPTPPQPIRVELIGSQEAANPQRLERSRLNAALLGLWAAPAASGPRLDLARIEMSRGRFAQAYSQLTLALLTADDASAVLFLRGDCAFRLERWADAAANLGQALQRNPSSAPTQLLHARALQKHGKHAAAIADLTTLLVPTKNDPFLWELRATSQAALGNNAEAAADRKAARNHVKAADARDLNNKAWQLVQGARGAWDPEHAEALARHATLLAPQRATYWNTLGVAQYRLGRYRDAMVSFHASLARADTDADGFDLFFLSMCHARQGDHAAAQASYAQATRWVGRRNNLPTAWVAELRDIRDEAAAVLRDTQAGKQ